MRILIVEDHQPSQRALELSLGQRGHAVDSTASAVEAYGMAELNWYDALIVDIGLPEGKDAGLELVSRLRQSRVTTPVLFLTAHDSLDDRVNGLMVGGDDYLIKPCHLREIEARLLANVRRVRSVQQAKLQRGPLEVDFVARSVSLAGQVVQLTQKEYAILELLTTHPGRYFRRIEIVDRVWNEAGASDEKVVTTYIKTLRRKLGRDTIKTVRDLGYCFPMA